MSALIILLVCWVLLVPALVLIGSVFAALRRHRARPLAEVITLRVGAVDAQQPVAPPASVGGRRGA